MRNPAITLADKTNAKPQSSPGLLANACLHIALTPNSIALARSTGWWQTQSVLLAEQRIDTTDQDVSDNLHDVLIKTLRALLMTAGVQRMPVNVRLADSLVRTWTVTPPQNAASLADCMAATTMRFQALHGESMSDWALSADVQVQRPFLASALPRRLLTGLQAGLQAVAKEQYRSLISVQAHSLATWNHWRTKFTSQAWLALVQDNMLVLGATEQNRLVAVRALALPRHDEHQTRTWLITHLQREALRLNLTAPNVLQLVGDVPESWLLHPSDGLRTARLGSANVKNAQANSPAKALLNALLTWSPTRDRQRQFTLTSRHQAYAARSRKRHSRRGSYLRWVWVCAALLPVHCKTNSATTP